MRRAARSRHLLRFAKRCAAVRRLTISMKQNTIFQAVAIVAAGILLALVANAFASRDRKVSLVGTYPNALKVPARETPQPIAAPVATAPVVTATQPAIATPTAPVTAITATQPTAAAAIETVGINPATKTPPLPARTTTAPATHPPRPAPTAEFNAHPDKPYIEIGFADVKALHAKIALFL